MPIILCGDYCRTQVERLYIAISEEAKAAVRCARRSRMKGLETIKAGKEKEAFECRLTLRVQA